jgi:hypothetical protein
MAKANLEVPVAVSEVKPVNQFVATLGEFTADITKSAEMLAAVEKQEDTITNTKAGLSSILYGVLVSQCESVLDGKPYAGEPVLFGWFEAVRLTWEGAYNSARGGNLEDTAIRKGWSRAFGCVSDDYGMKKPVAETKGAEAKSAKRAEEKQAIAALIAEVPVAELQDRAKSLYNKVPELKGKAQAEALKEAKFLTKAIDTATSAETELLKEQVKQAKDDIRALLKEVADLYVLQEVRDLLQGAHDDAVYGSQS